MSIETEPRREGTSGAQPRGPQEEDNMHNSHHDGDEEPSNNSTDPYLGLKRKANNVMKIDGKSKRESRNPHLLV